MKVGFPSPIRLAGVSGGLGFASHIVGPGLAGQAAFWAGKVGLAVARQAPEIAFAPEWVEVKQGVAVLQPGARRFTGREGVSSPVSRGQTAKGFCVDLTLFWRNRPCAGWYKVH